MARLCQVIKLARPLENARYSKLGLHKTTIPWSAYIHLLLIPQLTYDYFYLNLYHPIRTEHARLPQKVPDRIKYDSINYVLNIVPDSTSFGSYWHL